MDPFYFPYSPSKGIFPIVPVQRMWLPLNSTNLQQPLLLWPTMLLFWPNYIFQIFMLHFMLSL